MYDVIFIGSGHACWHGAVMLSAAGKKVAILDHDVAGGTCTNYGCDAKILLDGPFEFVEGLERYKGLCVDEIGKIDWKKLMVYKKEHFAPLAEAATNQGVLLHRRKSASDSKASYKSSTADAMELIFYN